MKSIAPWRQGWLAGDATPWVWALMSFIGFLATGGLAFIAFKPGMWAVVWTPLAGLAVLGTARLAFGKTPHVPARAAAVLIAGAAVSGAVDASLRDWSTARFAYLDPDMIGVTSIFFAIVVGVAVAGFGALLAPPRAALPPALAVLVGVLMTALIGASNLQGLGNGIEPESLVLAAVMAVATVYVVIVGVLSVSAWRDGERQVSYTHCG